MANPHFSRGFTLIEIISVLVILGVLAAVAVPKYYDLQQESEKKAALAAVAEAQARINLAFGQQLLQGKPCDEAVKQVASIQQISDDGTGTQFGDFSLGTDATASGGTLVAAGSLIYARRGENGTVVDTGAKLYLPSCGETESAAANFLFNDVYQMQEYLFKYGNNDHGKKGHGRDSQEFKDMFLNKEIDMGNGVTARFSNSIQGDFFGSNEKTTVTVVFSNKNTNESMTIKFTKYSKDDNIDINQMYFNDGKQSGNGTRIVDKSYAHRDENTLAKAQQVAKNLGLNINGLGYAFDSSQTGEMKVAADQFTF